MTAQRHNDALELLQQARRVPIRRNHHPFRLNTTPRRVDHIPALGELPHRRRGRVRLQVQALGKTQLEHADGELVRVDAARLVRQRAAHALVAAPPAEEPLAHGRGVVQGVQRGVVAGHGGLQRRDGLLGGRPLRGVVDHVGGAAGVALAVYAVRAREGVHGADVGELEARDLGGHVGAEFLLVVQEGGVGRGLGVAA